MGLLHLSFSRYIGISSAEVEMIELIRKGRGIGRKVIREVFRIFHLDTLTGHSIPSAILFWESIGADFNWLDEDEREYAIEDSVDTSYFEIPETSV